MSTVLVVISVSDPHGLSGSDSGGQGQGFEMPTKSITHKIQMTQRNWAAVAPGLATRWTVQWKEGSGRMLIRLTCPSAILSSVLSSALSSPPLYPILPRNQFSFLAAAYFMRNEARILQCERYIARNVSTATIVSGLQLAFQLQRPILASLLVQWLRKTGGITPGYLLTHSGKQLLVDVDAGRLFQGEGDNIISFELAALSALLADERARKRPFYAPIKGIGLDEYKAELARTNVPNVALIEPKGLERKFFDTTFDSLLQTVVDDDTSIPDSPASDAARSSPSSTGRKLDSPADIAILSPRGVGNVSNPQHSCNEVTSRLGVTEVGVMHAEVQVPARSLDPAAAAAAKQTASLSDTHKLYSGPGLGWPNMVRYYITRRRDGDGPCRVMQSGPGEGLTLGVGSTVAGVGSGTMTSTTAALASGANGEEWDGIVSLKLGQDGDENTFVDGSDVSKQPATALLPWLQPHAQASSSLPSAAGTLDRTLPLQTHRCGMFDHTSVEQRDAPPLWGTLDRTFQGAPCPLHDGRRPVIVPGDSAAFDVRRFFGSFDEEGEPDMEDLNDLTQGAFQAAQKQLAAAGEDAPKDPQAIVRAIQSFIKPSNGRAFGSPPGKCAYPTRDQLQRARCNCTCIQQLWQAPPSGLTAAATSMVDTVNTGKVSRPNKFGSRHIYELRREIDDSLVMVAASTSVAGKFIFSASPHILHLGGHAGPYSAGCDPDHYLGVTACNVLGTCITCYDWGMPVDQYAATPMPGKGGIGVGPAGPLLGHPLGVLPELGQRELCRINYDTNIFASAPNKMTVELRDHDAYDIDRMLGRPSSIPTLSGLQSSPFTDVVLNGVDAEAFSDTSGTMFSLKRDGNGGRQSLRVGPVPIPSLSAAGPLSTPADIDLRVCTPSTGFGVGVGATSGVGSWSGMLASAWKSIAGTTESPTTAVSNPSPRGISSMKKQIGVPPSAVLMTRQPRWSERLEAWTMDFHGRVMRPSKKNCQLVAVPLEHLDNPTPYVTDHSSPPALLFGKVAKDRFALDVSPGLLSSYQAFAIALSTFASKLAVA
jgi:hypothetical protein